MENIKGKLKALVADDRTEEALKLLQEIIDPKNQERAEDFNAVVSRQSQFNRLKKKSVSGIIDHATHSRESNEINNAVLSLIDQVTEEEARIYDIKHSIFQRILLVYRDESEVESFKKLFSNRYKKLFGPIMDTDFQAAEKYDLIVYNNFPKEIASTGTPVGLEEILDETEDDETMILIYSPNTLYELQDKHYDRIYFSNSKFSIHTRIQEMLQFLTYEAINS